MTSLQIEYRPLESLIPRACHSYNPSDGPTETPTDRAQTWRPVPSHEGYEVSNDGKVRGIKSGRVLSQAIDPTGRCRVNLWRNNRYQTIRVHRLVALAFLGPQPLGTEVAHLDGNPGNNHLTNLTWATPVENARHKKWHGTQPMGEDIYCAKLTTEQVIFVKQNYTGQHGQQARFARMFDVSLWAIKDIIRGRNWKHIHVD